MKTNNKVLLVILTAALGIFTACSESKFSTSPQSVMPLCAQGRSEVSCQPCADSENCSTKYDYSVDSEGQKTDILFVVDNSGSMYADQKKMASKFPSFLSSISNLDYRIAVTTTDVSLSPNNPPAPKNEHGALQDGRLIPFQNGASFLSGELSTRNEQTYFQKVIKRRETLACENSPDNRDICPSGDERGILAAAMTIQNNPASFIRPHGHLAIVFLSDENEGSNGNIIDLVERPHNFVKHFSDNFPNKSLKAHSIIIDQNTSAGQLYFQQQAREYLAGRFGTIYAELSRTTDGIIGNICASNYTNQLRDIGESVAQPREVLLCNPIRNSLKVSFSPEPSYSVTYNYNSRQKEVLFSKSLPAGTKIHFKYSCAE